MYRIRQLSSANKEGLLLKQDRRLFHTQDLSLIWGINNRNTLYTTIKRLIKKGTLIPIHKGFYSTIPLTKVDPVELGTSALHEFAYLSVETVIAQAGIINQSIPAVTLISNTSKKFTINQVEYQVRQLNGKFLFNDFGLYLKNHYLQARVERAIADLLYYNPDYYFDQADKINWTLVKQIQKEVGYK